MGEVIRFPDEAGSRRGRYVDASTQPATVIILPVIRIERMSDNPADGIAPKTRNNPGRRRRRRAAP